VCIEVKGVMKDACGVGLWWVGAANVRRLHDCVKGGKAVGGGVVCGWVCSRQRSGLFPFWML